MSIKERPVAAGLRELETFGRRLAETQGVPADAHVDWVSYGRAAQDALRRGHGIPLVGPFVGSERSSDLNAARPQRGLAPWRPVPIRTPPLPGTQPCARRHMVRPVTSAKPSRHWLFRLSGPPCAERRILSAAWCVHVGAGTSWRIAIVLLTLGMVAAGVQPVDTALLVAGAGILLPKAVRDPRISLLRWSLLSVFIARLLATTSFRYLLVGALMTAPLAAIVAARRWRLSRAKPSAASRFPVVRREAKPKLQGSGLEELVDRRALNKSDRHR
jgi:hypothetical protein